MEKKHTYEIFRQSVTMKECTTINSQSKLLLPGVAQFAYTYDIPPAMWHLVVRDTMDGRMQKLESQHQISQMNFFTCIAISLTML